ncbi:hypothetical protein PUN28_013336 [Cardiocondyla obscurior]|uniref:Uncharacterized protein n=1 Tax=Cardiocondyla obscurior TaxID=286306 RepID=A0AAW2F7R4_9HYME
MPPLRGELLRSVMMGQARRIVKARTPRWVAAARSRGKREREKKKRNAFMQNADLINVPRFTTQSTPPSLLSYTNYARYNTLIDFRGSSSPFDLHTRKTRCGSMPRVTRRCSETQGSNISGLLLTGWKLRDFRDDDDDDDDGNDNDDDDNGDNNDGRLGMRERLRRNGDAVAPSFFRASCPASRFRFGNLPPTLNLHGALT